MAKIPTVLEVATVTAEDVANRVPSAVALVDGDGNPVELGGSAPAAGSLTPAQLSGYDPGTGHGKVPQVKDDGSGFDFVSMPAVPAAPTAATLGGATDTGKALIQAKDAAAARTAIGAGVPYTLPAATATVVGGVKKAAAVAAPAAGADAAALVTWATALTNSLKAAGILS